MPLRTLTFEGLAYAFIILMDPKWGDDGNCHVMMIPGTVAHFSLAQLLMHFAQNTPCVAEVSPDGNIWGWSGNKARLVALLGPELHCACANCWSRCATCMVQQCQKCHYFRYCSRECSQRHWKPRWPSHPMGHKHFCPQMTTMYDRFCRRNSRFRTVAYGFMSAYDYNLWAHLLTDVAHSSAIMLDSD